RYSLKPLQGDEVRMRLSPLHCVAQHPLECRNYLFRPQFVHARVARDDTGLVLEAILDTGAAFYGCAYHNCIWRARRPQMNRAGGVSIRVVAEDTHGWTADRGGDMHRPGVDDHGGAGLLECAG